MEPRRLPFRHKDRDILCGSIRLDLRLRRGRCLFHLLGGCPDNERVKALFDEDLKGEISK